MSLQALNTQDSSVMAQSLLIHAFFAALLALAFIINLYTLFKEKFHPIEPKNLSCHASDLHSFKHRSFEWGFYLGDATIWIFF